MEHKFIKLKSFNPSLLEIQVATISPALPKHVMWFAGFQVDSTSPGRVEPILSPSKIVGKSVVKGKLPVIDSADKGEIRYTTEVKFSAQQLVDLEALLDAHDHTVDSLSQAIQSQLQADLVALEVRAQSATLPSDLQLIADIILALHK